MGPRLFFISFLLWNLAIWNLKAEDQFDSYMDIPAMVRANSVVGSFTINSIESFQGQIYAGGESGKFVPNETQVGVLARANSAHEFELVGFGREGSVVNVPPEGLTKNRIESHTTFDQLKVITIGDRSYLAVAGDFAFLGTLRYPGTSDEHLSPERRYPEIYPNPHHREEPPIYGDPSIPPERIWASKSLGLFDGENWITIDEQTDPTRQRRPGRIRAMTAYKNTLIIRSQCGGIERPLNVNYFCYQQWNGSDWKTIARTTEDDQALGGAAHGALAVFKDKLIISGNFRSVCPEPAVPTRGGYFSGYEAGICRVAEIPAGGIAMWDEKKWTAMVDPAKTTFGGFFTVDTLSVIQNATNQDTALVVGGAFQNLNGVNSSLVALFNGTQWQPIGRGLKGDGVTNIGAIGSDVFVVGDDIQAAQSNVLKIGFWDHPVNTVARFHHWLGRYYEWTTTPDIFKDDKFLVKYVLPLDRDRGCFASTDRLLCIERSTQPTKK